MCTEKRFEKEHTEGTQLNHVSICHFFKLKELSSVKNIHIISLVNDELTEKNAAKNTADDTTARVKEKCIPDTLNERQTEEGLVHTRA